MDGGALEFGGGGEVDDDDVFVSPVGAVFVSPFVSETVLNQASVNFFNTVTQGKRPAGGAAPDTWQAGGDGRCHGSGRGHLPWVAARVESHAGTFGQPERCGSGGVPGGG